MNTVIPRKTAEGAAKRRPALRHALGSGPGCIAACLLLFGVCGCKVTTPKHVMEESVHSKADIAVSAQQIRLRMRALVEPLCAAVIESADQIRAGTTNRVIQREALVWKIEGVPALREALFRPNPYAAILDSWVFTWQMTDYFEKGRGKEALGSAAPVAVATCQYLENQIREVTASMMISGDVSDVRTFARDWAGTHPIRYTIGSRESTLSRVTERELHETFSTQELAGNVAVTLDDLTRRMDVYSVQLLDQSRWQAELFAMDLADNYRLEQAMPLMESAVQSATEAVDTLKRLEPSLQDTLAVTKAAPELISRERATAVEAAQTEISRTLEFVEAERIAVFDYVTQERLAALKELSETIAEERKITLNDAEQIAQKTVDHAILRAAQLMAGVLACVFVGVVVLLFITRRLFAARTSNHP